MFTRFLFTYSEIFLEETHMSAIVWGIWYTCGKEVHISILLKIILIIIKNKLKCKLNVMVLNT